MAITTADEFFTVLERSRLLEAKQSAEARRIAEGVEDPTTIAKLLARQGLITHWQAGQLLAGRAVFFVGKYKLIRKLGRGGGGNVFLGEHVTMNRRVALKFISRQMGRDQASLARFLAEARAIAALDHPNIVQAYSVDNEGDRYYIVMEYIDGSDLQRLVETEGPLGCGLAADYIRQAAEGLAHAHAHNMVHCAVKPSSLLVSPQGVVKILDVGLSRLIAGEGGVTPPEGRVSGSVDYLAPEQTLEHAEVDARTDIYALGCTLFFLLTGHPPFPEGTAAERIRQHQTQQPPDIRRQRPNAPAELIDICVKMMAKRPADRFQSAAEVSHALQQWALASGSKPVVPLKVSAEEDVAEPELNFAADPWWDTLSASPARNKTPSRKSGRMQAVKAVAAAPAAAPVPAAAAPVPAAAASAPVVATGVNDVLARTTPKMSGWLNVRRRKIAALCGLGLLAAMVIGAAAMIAFWGKPNSAVQRPAPPPTPPKEKPAEVFPDIQVHPGTDNHGKEGGGVRPAEPKGDHSGAKASEPKREGPPQKPETKPVPLPKPAPSQSPPPIAVVKVPQPKPAPVKAADAKKKPLGDLQPIDLPAIGSDAGGAAASFGAVHLAAGDTLGLKLLSSDHGSTVIPKFVLRQKAEAGRKENWLVAAAPSGKADESSADGDVARIWLEKGGLKFQWLKAAADARADYLRACGLLLAAGGDSRFLPLGVAHEEPPLVVDLNKVMVKTELKNKFLPEAAALRLQLVGLDEKSFPKHELKIAGKGPVDAAKKAATPIASKETAEIHFTDPKLAPFGVRIAFAASAHSATVTVTAIYKPPPSPHQHHGRDMYIPFKYQEATKMGRQLITRQQALKQITENSKIDEKQRKDAGEKLKGIEFLLSQITALFETVQKIGGLKFRIYAEVNDGKKTYQVDMFKTPTPAAATKTAAGK